MKIAHFESSMNWGGQELRIVEQTIWLNQNNHQTWIIARPGSCILEHARKRNLPVFELQLHGSSHPKTLFKLHQFLRKQQIDLLDCHGGRDSYYGAYIKAISKVAVVRSRHVTDPIKSNGLRGFIWRHGNHAIITTAHKIRSMLLADRLSNAKHIFVAPAGVDEQRFQAKLDATKLKQQLNIPAKNLVIANVGMIRPDKGQLYFIEAALALLEQNRQLSFIQIGEATGQTQAYYQQIIKLAGDKNGHGIYFLGYHSDIENYLALADIVVISSIATEAQTRLVGQASLMNKALIATKVGGLPEMIGHEQTGLLCEAKSSDELQQAICRLQENPDLRQELCRKAYLRAKQEMGFDYMMQVMLEIYNHALQRVKK